MWLSRSFALPFHHLVFVGGAEGVADDDVFPFEDFGGALVEGFGEVAAGDVAGEEDLGFG